MRRVFADTYYWIALINDHDQGHAEAVAMSLTFKNDTLVTTHEVLSEVLTFFSGYGSQYRRVVANYVRDILNHPSITVEPQSEESFLSGLSLYEARLDKHYSHADCISMVVMRRAGIREVLTGDDHFTQEGFVTLLGR